VGGLKLVLYLLAILSSLTCATLLMRAYLQRRVRLLMWSAICFIGLTINNVALFVDLVLFPEIDLRLLRLVPALLGMSCLLYGFILDVE
jgi:uncharacterized protein DUF5985